MSEQERADAIKKAEKSIVEAIARNGPYSHNVIGMSLSILSQKCGKEAANALVDKFKLTRKYGIHKEK